jgi:hypothetical protein
MQRRWFEASMLTEADDMGIDPATPKDPLTMKEKERPHAEP